MSFGKLYRELCNDSLTKPSTDTDYFEQRGSNEDDQYR